MNAQELGHTTLVQHYNDTGNERPIRTPQCHVPPLIRKKTDAHVETLLQQDVIQPSLSLVLVTKCVIDRSCVDCLDLNKVTRRDSYFLTRVQDILNFLPGIYYYIILDDSQPKTTFVTHDCLKNNVLKIFAPLRTANIKLKPQAVT